LWDEAPDDAARELVKDLCVQRAFRRDVFVRGLRRVPRDAAVDALWVATARHRQGEVSLVAQAGVAKLPQPLIDAVRGALVEGPRTIGALRALPGCGNTTPSELIALLMGSDSAVPLWLQPGSGADWDQAVAVARRLNVAAANRLAPYGVGGSQMGLATPALAGGLSATALELAVVNRIMGAQFGGVGAALAGEPDAAEIVRRLIPLGPGPGVEIVEELERKVGVLLGERLPVWRMLGVV